MPDFGINEMLDMQKRLQDKYKDKWEQISPETGKHKLLWMIGEIGEVIDMGEIPLDKCSLDFGCSRSPQPAYPLGSTCNRGR